jgi:spore coat protein CotF
MPFGAHESMEVHEILSEKVCMINHLGFYATQVQDHHLGNMIQRHLQAALTAYNQLANYTHDYRQVPAATMQMSTVAVPNRVQYGLNNPAPVMPTPGALNMNDREIASSLLLAHKNAAKNQMAASLECADPNVRQILLNQANSCNYFAYEVFQYMNQRGYYQVPTMQDHTAKTMLHQYRMV